MFWKLSKTFGISFPDHILDTLGQEVQDFQIISKLLYIHMSLCTTKLCILALVERNDIGHH